MNYYEIFGISQSASSEVINATHKKLAKKYHPDINSSADAHEKMTLLNKAHEVLSDSSKRAKYDDELKQRQQKQMQYNNPAASQRVHMSRSRSDEYTEERADKAETLRKKAEARMKYDEALRIQREERAKLRSQQKANETIQSHRQIKKDIDRQHVLSILSSIVMDGNNKRKNNIDIDEDLHNATKVLLSLVRQDNEHLRRVAEENERKQRIKEILSMVEEINNEKDKLV